MESQDLSGGFVVPPLLRFLSAEGAYLANAHGGPRMFMNLEDHLSANTGRANTRFQARRPNLGVWLGFHVHHMRFRVRVPRGPPFGKHALPGAQAPFGRISLAEGVEQIRAQAQRVPRDPVPSDPGSACSPSGMPMIPFGQQRETFPHTES